MNSINISTTIASIPQSTRLLSIGFEPTPAVIGHYLRLNRTTWKVANVCLPFGCALSPAEVSVMSACVTYCQELT